MIVEAHLPTRSGARPETGPASPHQQLSQISPVALQDELWQPMVALEGVSVGPSQISLPDTRALHLDPRLASGPPEAFAPIPGSTEFAHLHGPSDGSVHASMPEDLAAAAIEAGWAELHPMARQGPGPRTAVMLYGPRDEAELDVIWNLVRASYAFARGQDADAPREAAAPGRATCWSRVGDAGARAGAGPVRGRPDARGRGGHVVRR